MFRKQPAPNWLWAKVPDLFAAVAVPGGRGGGAALPNAARNV